MTDNRIVVIVDEDLEELIPGFLENRNKDVQVLRDAMGNDDFSKLKSIGHSLKGVGGGYGFDGLSEIGAKIEIAAKASDMNAVRELIDAMADYLGRVDVVYE